VVRRGTLFFQAAEHQAGATKLALSAGASIGWASRADKKLLEPYIRVATAIGFKPEASNVDKIGDDETLSESCTVRPAN
jgi:hypothetical protein